MSNVAQAATRHPFHDPLRAALRLRRDGADVPHGHYGSMRDVFDYFVKFGDGTDLEWMEKAVERLSGSRQAGMEKVQELRARLKTN